MIVPNRLFFALLPNARTRDAIAHASKALTIKQPHGGRDIAPTSFHLTLMFLGDAVPAAEEQAACAAAATVRCDPFDLVLNAAGSFPSAWWLGQRQPSPELLHLRKRLQGAITALKVGYDRQHFAPHVTVARSPRSRLPSTNIGPIMWRCESFELMRSSIESHGSTYQSVARWALDAKQPEEAGQLPLI